MDLEKYVIVLEDLGKFEPEGRNIFVALEELKKTLRPDLPMKILSAHIIINNDFLIDITSSINGI
jgi:hypothetical protein